MKISVDDIQKPGLIVRIFFSHIERSSDINTLSCVDLAEMLSTKFNIPKNEYYSDTWNSSSMWITVNRKGDFHDTDIFTWVINEDYQPGLNWEKLSKIVGDVLLPLEKTNLLKTIYWGISLIYNGTLSDFPMEGEIDIHSVLNQNLFLGDTDRKPEDLARNKIPGGLMWLTAISSKDHSFRNPNIYFYLYRDQEENVSARFILDDMFTSLDLVAQKAYYEKIDYNQLKNKGYDLSLRELKECTKNLLNKELHSEQNGDEKKKEKAGEKSRIQEITQKIKDLAEKYDKVLDTSINIVGLKTSMLYQRLNIESLISLDPDPTNHIWNFHHRHIIAYSREMEIQVNQTEQYLQSAEQAVNIADSEVEQEKEMISQRYQQILTIIGTLLAAPELIQLDTIERVLEYYQIHIYNPLWIFGFQIVIIIILVMIALYLLNFFSKRIPRHMK